MQLVVLANASQREELLSCGLDDKTKLTFVNALGELQQYSNADCIIDLLFDGSSDRIAVLRSFPTVIINSVIESLSQLNVSFVRINGWPGFLQRPMVEASCNITHLKQQAENIFASFNKQTCWLQDKTGFVTARVVAMIINEAWFALQENVSTKSEIDIAMRLGTNYPFGPFEWCGRIGVKNIYGLLNELAKTDSRYEPAALLKKGGNSVALILNIDTSLEAANITLADHGNVLAEESNENQKDHAAWIQPAMETLIKNAHSDLRNVKAIGISNGPGSYTGLRIGLATAKGLCYALGIPLITINTLAVLAFDAITKIERGNLQIFNNDSNAERSDFIVADLNIEKMLFCPMIDARRMEVFTAVYNRRLMEIIQPQACILIPTLFEELLERQKILFLGNGNKKFQPMCQNAGNAMFRNLPLNSSALAALTYRNFVGSNFAGLAYTEPLYLKEFFTQ